MQRVHRDLHVILYILRQKHPEVTAGKATYSPPECMNFSVFLCWSDGILTPSERKAEDHHFSSAPCPRIPLNQSREVGGGSGGGVEGSQTLRFQIIKQAEFN